MKSLRDILAQRSQTIGKGFISREFQDYGYRLAQELGDLSRKALYMKLAKTLPRNLLEQARIFVKDATTARSRPRLFMWKLKELKMKTTPTTSTFSRPSRSQLAKHTSPR